MFGGMDTDDREDVKAAFQSSPEVSPVRILLATDAAAEGINLENHCPFLLSVDPVLVGFDQRLQLRAVLYRVGLGQELHIENQPIQLGEGGIDLGILGPGRGRLRNLVARHDLGADPDGVVGVGR